MSELVRLELPDGHLIWARVELADGPTDVGWRPADVLTSLDDLGDTIRAVGTMARTALAGLRPDTVSVDFGVELALKGGKVVSVLTEIGGKASLHVTLGWQGAPEPSGPDRDDDEDDASPLDGGGRP